MKTKTKTHDRKLVESAEKVLITNKQTNKELQWIARAVKSTHLQPRPVLEYLQVNDGFIAGTNGKRLHAGVLDELFKGEDYGSEPRWQAPATGVYAYRDRSLIRMQWDDGAAAEPVQLGYIIDQAWEQNRVIVRPLDPDHGGKIILDTQLNIPLKALIELLKVPHHQPGEDWATLEWNANGPVRLKFGDRLIGVIMPLSNSK